MTSTDVGLRPAHRVLRRLGVGGLVVGGFLLLGAAVATVPTAPPAAAAVSGPVNPVRPVAPDDAAADPSHHFLVLVEGNAGLYENETEGTVLVGGNLAWRGYQVTPRAGAAEYTVPGDTDPAGLVVQGMIDFTGSTGGTGTLFVQNQTNAYLADLGNADVITEGGNTFAVPTGGTVDTRPAIDVQHAESEESIHRDAGFDVPTLFATYREIAQRMAACPATLDLLDQNGSGPWPGTGPATIRLVPGQNVLTLSVDQLGALRNLNLAGGSAQLGPADLIINVPDSGDYDWPVPSLGFQGNVNSRHILWNLASTGTVTLPASESDTVWGTVYAPNAELIDHSSANIEGNVVVRELQHGGPNSGNGGEIHNAPFDDTFTPCGGPPTTTETTTTETTTTESTTEPTTTETTTTESTTESTEPTTTETTTGPTTTEPTTTESTTEPTTAPTTQPSTSVAPPPAGGGTGGTGGGTGRLAFTGVELEPLVVGGLALILIGGCLLVLVARRQ
ncbi:MAG TPA: collagen-binding domain-containing protein [Pseudonocardiaceae bacterium]|nr:collagen-binding domain-containing protein [Pseudonocardiaceae bacterium]